METWFRLNSHKTCIRGGIIYELDVSEVIDRAIYLRGWEPGTIDFLKRNVSNDQVEIEVGANIGAHTLILADLVGDKGKVFAFEPTNYAQKKLRANLTLNPRLAERVIVRSELVTNHGHATPNLSIRSSFPVDRNNQHDEFVNTAAIALDDLELARLDLLKIDVDGYDFKVLQGAVKLIERFKPLIFVELCQYTLAAQGDSVHKIFDLLSNLGYIAFNEDGSRIRDSDEVLRLIGTETSINGVFRSKELAI